MIVNGLPDTEDKISTAVTERKFNVVMALKTLRILHAREVTDTLRRIMSMLSEVFYMRRYFFENLGSWILAAAKFLMAIHYFACGWILIHEWKKLNGLVYVQFQEEDSISGAYFEAIYLTTTTISTVGYGDIKGFVDTEGVWEIEMSFLLILILCGVLLFSSVTHEIFTYKTLMTAKEIA